MDGERDKTRQERGTTISTRVPDGVLHGQYHPAQGNDKAGDENEARAQAVLSGDLEVQVVRILTPDVRNLLVVCQSHGECTGTYS